MVDDIYEQADDLWSGFDELSEPPDDDTAVTAAERQEVDPAEFWKSRQVLTHIHDFARARRTGPWAVLGSVLARVVCSTPPDVVLPPTTGGVASLNLFVGLVGPSGQGKDAAQKTAKIAFDLNGNDFLEAPLGSGEGLSHMFMRPVKASLSDSHPPPAQYNTRAYVRIGEIDTFAALANRQASTLTTQLRQGAMGEELGFFYVDVAKRMIVPEHAYRLCLVAGIQPNRSAVLLEDADGGTPQRFVWLPSGDPGAPRTKPSEPTPMIWATPDWSRCRRLHEGGKEFHVVDLPDVAVEAMDTARWERLTLTGEALDSHALITRAKVASALAFLDGRLTVTEEDWRLSGVVMAVSDTQRSLCVKALAKIAEKANRSKAVAEAERAVVIEDRVSKERLRRVCDAIRRRLLRHDGAEPIGKLKNALDSTVRPLFESALESMTIAGDVVTEERDKAVYVCLRVAP